MLGLGKGITRGGFAGSLEAQLQAILGAGNFGFVNLTGGKIEIGGDMFVSGAWSDDAGTYTDGGYRVNANDRLDIVSSGILTWSAATVWSRVQQDAASSANFSPHAWCYFGTGASPSAFTQGTTGLTNGETWTAGDDAGPNSRNGTSNLTWSAAEDFATVYDCVNKTLHKNTGAAITMNWTVGTVRNYSPGAVGVTTELITWGGTTSSTMVGVLKVLVVAKVTPSEADRNAVTNLINAL